ncbi:hypothetical protein BDW22DRAFT_1362544 [Trametopsis cervina]|nr:hypothetical protein BDW22DRAFT_1362544 [Trametopsis cervina]
MRSLKLSDSSALVSTFVSSHVYPSFSITPLDAIQQVVDFVQAIKKVPQQLEWLTVFQLQRFNAQSEIPRQDSCLANVPLRRFRHHSCRVESSLTLRARPLLCRRLRVPSSFSPPFRCPVTSLRHPSQEVICHPREDRSLCEPSDPQGQALEEDSCS